MPTIKVLKPGYSYPEAAGQRADCTITLIRDEVQNILVDTGNPADGPELVRLLAEEGLSPTDITIVVCSHGHSDHIGNNGLFPQARFIFAHDISQGDLFISHLFAQEPYHISADIEVIATPGHTAEDLSVLVKTPQGLVAIVGDLFESEHDEELWRSASRLPDQQTHFRTLVHSQADFIVPGHGNIFPVRV